MKSFLSLTLALSSQSLLAAPISKIVVEGSRRIESDAILEKMKLKVGAEPTSEAVRADVLSIFGMGYFEDVRFETRGTDLVVSVRERPVVVEIAYEGNEEFESKDLDEATSIKPFTVVNPTKIRLAQTAIAKKYEEKGYYLARADAQLITKGLRPGEAKLLFKIQENEKVRIRRIHFLGNNTFSSGDLKQVMQTAEGHVFSWATSGGTYREGAFERDLAVLAFFYGNEGYIEAKFAKPRVTLSQDRRYIDVFIEVDEGKRFYLGNVSFEGDLLFSEDSLRDGFKMREKDVFSTGKLQEQILALTDRYGDEGYAFANVIPRPTIREGTDIVDLSISLEKGEKVYWGKITVSGNAKTHDKVIRRELRFVEGELYNATKRKKSLERVRALGFFGQDVNFITTTPKGSNNLLDLDVRVVEKPTGSLNVAAGYGSGQGFTFTTQISQNNLFGRGQQLSLSLSYSHRDSKNFQLQFTDPKVFDTEWLAGFDAYLQDNRIGDPMIYRQFLGGANFRIGREIAENLMLLGTYKIQHNRLVDPIALGIFSDPTKDQNSIISSVEASLSYDTRNNRLDPSNGEYFTLSAEFAGLGGRRFQKIGASTRFYRRLFWKAVFRTNLEYGLLANWGTDSVPDAERFILGGIFSLRGYPNSSVGPYIELEPTRDDAVKAYCGKNATTCGGKTFEFIKGGTQKIVYNAEVEFPLIPDADIRTVFFFDAGNAWNNRFRDLSPTLLANTGWGIRWYSPLGPLRFEFGYPLTPKPPDHKSKGVEFQFIIAPTF